MTRIWIMSDLHVDYSRRTMGNLRLPSDVAADVCVVAGDVAGRLSKSGTNWLEQSFLGTPVVIVAGNHDLWGASVDTEIGKFKDRLKSDSVHLLDGEAVELSGVRSSAAPSGPTMRSTATGLRRCGVRRDRRE